MAGVIDPDYRGDVTILLHNFGDKHQQIKPGERITQLILERAEMVETVVVNELNPTERNTSGFGSTETKGDSTSKVHKVDTPILPATPPTKLPTKLNKLPLIEIVKQFPTLAYPSHQLLPNSMYTQNNQTAAAAKLFSNIQLTFEEPYTLNLDTCPYDNYTHRVIDLKRNIAHKNLDLVIQTCTDRNLSKLTDCKPGAPAMHIPRWQCELKN